MLEISCGFEGAFWIAKILLLRKPLLCHIHICNFERIICCSTITNHAFRIQMLRFTFKSGF